MAAPWAPVWDPNFRPPSRARPVSRQDQVDRIKAKFQRRFADGEIPLGQFRRMLSKLNPEWTSHELNGLVSVSRMNSSSADWRLFLDWFAGSHFFKEEMESMRSEIAALRQQVAELTAKIKDDAERNQAFISTEPSDTDEVGDQMQKEVTDELADKSLARSKEPIASMATPTVRPRRNSLVVFREAVKEVSVAMKMVNSALMTSRSCFPS